MTTVILGRLKASRNRLFYLNSWIKLALVITARGLWQSFPGIPTFVVFEVVFWTTFLLPSKRSSEPKPRWFVTLWPATVLAVLLFVTGVISNAICVFVNGGFMPVVNGNYSSDFSVWVHATGDHRLLWLADRYAGFSLGDFAIFASIFLNTSCSVIGKRIWPAAKEGA